MILLYNFLTDNAIATMYGPYFLVVYLLFIGAVYLIGYYYKNKFETAFKNSTINVGNLSEPDPYLIAYMRAGVSETSKLIVYNLLERGYIISSNQNKTVKQNPGHPAIENLNALEKLLFKHLKSSRSIENAVDHYNVLPEINKICQKTIANSMYNELLFAEVHLKALKKNITYMRFAIGIFGGYKLIVALSNGHTNVFFLILLMLLGIIITGYIFLPSRLTQAGENYIKDLQKIYSSKYSNGINYATSNYKSLLAGILGVYVFSELGYGYLINYEKKKSVVYDRGGGCSTSNCSSVSSCSSSSCSSGCGGGCGGCGG